MEEACVDPKEQEARGYVDLKEAEANPKRAVVCLENSRRTLLQAPACVIFCPFSFGYSRSPCRLGADSGHLNIGFGGAVDRDVTLLLSCFQLSLVSLSLSLFCGRGGITVQKSSENRRSGRIGLSFYHFVRFTFAVEHAGGRQSPLTLARTILVLE